AADEDGRWMVRLDPIESEVPLTVTISGSNEIVLSNVVIGDVWICSGQSNMVWPVARSLNAEDEIADANHPMIRLCQVQRATAQEPIDEVAAQWQPCTPETVPNFSAVGYFFGRDLHEQTGVPIGLISTNWGGTPVEAWTSREKLAGDPAFQPLLESWQTRLAAYPEALARYESETLPAWEKQVTEAREKGEQPPRKPSPPEGPDSPRRPGNLFNAMIHPLIPYGIAGAIWYQGEANAHGGVNGAWIYQRLFSAMIRDWRERWGQGDFPFAWVQLANFRAVREEPGPSAWADLREAQTRTLSLPATGMALAIDVGDAADIHPTDKQTVGHRLALWALATVYGQDVVYQGPTYESMDVEGSRIRIHFANINGGLRRGVTDNAPYPSPLLGFQIAGRDRRWVWADAEIQGDTVLAWSDQVRNPVAVRYAWADNPVANLYNDAGLPAVPFRTDRWPLSTRPQQ
ncbi:MAG: sialate O-acetylesterase, partial [Armatimonadota bacterium]